MYWSRELNMVEVEGCMQNMMPANQMYVHQKVAFPSVAYGHREAFSIYISLKPYTPGLRDTLGSFGKEEIIVYISFLIK